MLKRVVIMLFCLMMVFIATFGFVVGVVAVPTIYSYAETTNNFEPIRDQSDQVYAFQAYCKSRDLTIEGSISDAVTSYTTDAYNYACNKIGVNPTELQAEIQAQYDQTGKPVKFLFSAAGVDVFNRLFSQFLQDNELSVGDEDVNKIAYSGTIVTDNNNVSCLVTIIKGSVVSLPLTSNVLAYGNTYLMDGLQCRNYALTNGSPAILSTGFYNKGSNSIFNYTITTNWLRSDPRYSNYTVISQVANYLPSNAVYEISRNTGNRLNGAGYLSVLYFQGSNTYCLGSVFHDYIENKYYVYSLGAIDVNNDRNAQINLISTVINNNIYEGDTIINNEGDVIVEPDPIPPGGTDPGWDIGGGGGTATDGNGNTWNIQFPDFELPDLNIDWSINGLGEKFPFSIPFDLVALVTVLNAEPQAPRFEGTVNFGFTTWDYDINLQQFDSVAQACRIAELLLLVVGLILVTRSIIKG